VNQPKRRWIPGLGVSAAITAGCGTSDPSLRFAPSAFVQADGANLAGPVADARCKAFAATFDQLVACRRANVTLGSFSDPKVTWRVRYFVRYWEMPCYEAPTEQESYVFHTVTNDLYYDQNLDAAERVAIRNAMFDGEAHCE
jgi:hypothetical protein